MPSAHLLTLVGGSLAAALLAPLEANAQSLAARIDIDFWAASRLEDGANQLARLTVRPQARFDASDTWRFEGELRIDWSQDDVGLGSDRFYSEASRPLTVDDQMRIELERAVAVFRDCQESCAGGVLIIRSRTARRT
jgi:hypothetical protein